MVVRVMLCHDVIRISQKKPQSIPSLPGPTKKKNVLVLQEQSRGSRAGRSARDI